MIDRRTFLVGSASVLTTPFVAETQERKAAKIGFLLGGTLSTPSVQIEPFKQTLHEKGWIEGKNLTLEYRPAEGHYERLPALVRGFMSYGPNRPELWHKAALLTDKILRGAKPGDLPVEQPTKFELVINLKTAK